MSLNQDRLTFFGVLAAVVVVVLGYLQLGGLYPTTNQADASEQTEPNHSQASEDEQPAPEPQPRQEDALPEG